MQLAEWKWSKCYLQKPNTLAAHGMDQAKLDDNTLGQESKGQAFQRGKKRAIMKRSHNHMLLRC